MNIVKDLFRILRTNGKKMFEFELIYRIASMALLTPMLVLLFNLSLRFTGYRYITVDNLNSYITSPITIGILVLIVFILTFFALIDSSGNIYIIDLSYQNFKVNLGDVLKFALKNSIRAFSIRNIFMAFMVLILALVINIGVTATYATTISIPDFIMALIKTTPHLIFVIYIAAALVIIGFVRWMYFMHYFTIERCPFIKACKKSNRLNHKRKIKDIFIMVLLEMLCGLVFLAVAALCIAIVVGIYRLLSSYEILYYLLISAIIIVVNVLMLLFVVFLTPVMYACISVLFYKHKLESGEKIYHFKKKYHKINKEREKKFQRIEVIVLLVSTVLCSVYVYMISTGKVNFNVEYVKTMQVTAHRGASVKYPENTMCAFKGAVKLGADWIELDVQQTKDNEIIVMHDSNLKRTTGVNKNIWNVDYSEIEQLECGSWFDKKYSGEKVLTLKEVIEYAKDNNINLNIEIKPTGHEKDFEQEVVDMIVDEKFENQCVVTSQSYASLKKVKDYNPEIKTVYVMRVAYGSIVKLSSADAFSVKSYYVTENLVKNVHNAGKQIYVWTVNSEKTMQRMVDLNVDNIITDNISLAKKCIYEDKAGSGVISYINNVLMEKVTE